MVTSSATSRIRPVYFLTLRRLALLILTLASMHSFAQEGLPAHGTFQTNEKDGNQTLGLLYDRIDCGMDFVQASRKVTSRNTGLGSTAGGTGSGLPCALTIAGIPNCAIIDKAYVWIMGSFGIAPVIPVTGPLTIGVTNPAGSTVNYVGALVGQGPDKCWGETFSGTYRVDVTAAVSGTGNGVYTINVPAIPAAEIDGMTLMIIYKDLANNCNFKSRLMIYDGINTINAAAGVATATINGINPCENVPAANVKAFALSTDFQILAGGHNFNVGGNTTNEANIFYDFDSKGVALTTATASLSYSVSSGATDCFSLGILGLYYRTSTSAACGGTCNPLTIAPTNTGPYCIGSTVALAANLTPPTTCPFVYSWTGPNGFTSTSANPTVPATAAAAGTYTVTGSVSGSCIPSVTASTTVVVNPTPVAVPANNGPLCIGQTLNLTAGTVAGATYAWTGPNGFTSTSQNPSITSVTAAHAGTYTLTVTAGGCVSTPVTTTVVINSPPTATPASNSPVCLGSALNLTSNTVAGATYSWTGPNSFTSNSQNPTINPVTAAAAGTYTLTITSSGCASTPATTTVSITTPVVPSFPPLTPRCQGATAVSPATTSSNGIVGSWSPNPLSTATAGSVCATFTPNAGQCATTANICLTVTAPTTPTFTALGSVCQGDASPTLPASSDEGIPGTWNPTTLSTTSAGTVCATFTPNAGQCATTATLCLTVNAPVTPTFTALIPVCQGGTSPALPTTSTNSITGTWVPGTLSTASAGSVCATFTPNAGQCATTASLCLTINVPVTPTFNALTAVCQGDPSPALPTSSTNSPAITGSWSPGTLSTASPGSSCSTFTPTAGQCATTATLCVTVNTPTTPTFTALTAVCQGDPAPALPATSNNSINGSWTPGTLSTATSGSVCATFTPTAGQCATTATLCLTVNAPTTPSFTALSPVCEGAPAPALPPTSNNSFSGTWSPTTLNTATSGNICSTFTPNPGQCATTTTLCLTVTNGVTPTFDPIPNICQGATAPPLQLPSIEGATGAWNPTSINTSSSGTFTFTFTPDPGQCANSTTITVTIDPTVTPTFTALPTVCQGDPSPALSATSNNSISGTWSPASLSTVSTGSVCATFTPNAGQCATTATLCLTVSTPVTPTFASISNECIGGPAPSLPTSSTNSPAITGVWDSAPITTSAGTFNFTFTPSAGQCATTATISFTVDPNPTISCPSLSTCAGVPVSLTASGASTYSWAPSTNLMPATGATVSANPPATETYTITGTDVNGCVGTTTATVTISSNLTIVANPTALTICNNGDSGVIDVAGGTNYTWSPATGLSSTSGATVTASPTVTTTYTIDGETSGCVGSTTVVVTVTAPITPTFNSVGPLCQGSPGPTLPTSSTNSPSISGTWNSPTASTASAGPSTYTFTPATGECATTTTMSITVNSAPTVSGVVETCNSTNTQYTVEVTLSGGNVATYNVTGGTGSFTGNVWTSTPINSGTPYNFNFDDASGCGPVNVAGVKNCNCSTFAGTMSTVPFITCVGTPVTATLSMSSNLDGNDVLSYILHTSSGTTAGSVLASNTSPTFSFAPPMVAGTTYYISAVAGDNNGGLADLSDPCLSVSAGTPVVWNDIPVATPANNGPLCQGQTLSLTTSTVAGATYAWTGPVNYNIQNPTVASATTADAGTYTLIVTANTCSSTPVTTTVVINAPTTPTFNALASACQGTAAPGLPGSSNEGIPGGWSGTPSTSAAGTQNFTFTPAVGQCATTASLSFTVNAVPIANAGPDQFVCPGLPVTLTASFTGAPAGPAPTTYNWTNGVTNGVPFTPATTTSYVVIVDPGNGCTATDQVTVTVYPMPAITATANPTSACLGSSILFNGGGGVAPYLWDNGVINNSPFTPASAGTVTYNVGAQDANGCPGTASVSVTIFALPVIDGGPDQTLCPGAEVTLTANGGVTYTWDGAINGIPFVPNDTYTYTVTGTDGNGCQNTDQVVVTVSTPPQADFNVDAIELSVVDPTVNITNQSIGAATYAWTFGDGAGTSTAVDPSYTYDGSIATYTINLTATSVDGCVDQTSQTIIVKDQLIFWVPNTFTPDGDERNNVFQPVFTSGFDPYNFTMIIYNRWGEPLFETHDATIGWDGTYQGAMCENGIYTWTIKGKNPQNDEKFRVEGHVQILR